MNVIPRRSALLAGLLLLAFGRFSLAEEIHLDRYRVLGELPSGAKILIKRFGTEETNFGPLKKKRQQETADNMKVTAPLTLQQTIVQRLGEGGAFADVAAWEEGELPADAVLIEGSFTVLNPGNRNKRYWVGLGAGKAKVCVEGRVVDDAGELLGTFGDCRSGTGMMAFTGGRSEGMMSNDLYRCGFNVADFLSAWGQGTLPAPAKVK